MSLPRKESVKEGRSGCRILWRRSLIEPCRRGRPASRKISQFETCPFLLERDSAVLYQNCPFLFVLTAWETLFLGKSSSFIPFYCFLSSKIFINRFFNIKTLSSSGINHILLPYCLPPIICPIITSLYLPPHVR